MKINYHSIIGVSPHNTTWSPNSLPEHAEPEPLTQPGPNQPAANTYGGFEATRNQWERQVAQLREDFADVQASHQRDGQARAKRLQELRAVYERECASRNRVVAGHNAQVDAFSEAFSRGDPEAIVEYYTLVLTRSAYPDGFPQQFRVAYVPESAQLVVEYELPTIVVVPTVAEYRYVKTKDEQTEKARPQKEVRSQYASVVAQVALRTVHELFEADRGKALGTVIFNGIVRTTDPSTGKQVQPCLVSLRATRDAFSELDLAHVDPLACLAHLSATVSKRPDDLAPVRPVMDFDMVDKRFVEESDVLSDLDQRPNLLELTPTEFESLIQNLFAKMGLDTKQTQASRDGGVDCVAFDHRTILGGKVVIQAKRYRHTVGVSAVRDLYGTLMNEGASKGILVATSGYGQASHQFAADKPIELIDGSGLLYLLAEHAGIEARIVDPEEMG